MLQDPTALQTNVGCKRGTTTALTPMKIEYEDEMKWSLLDSLGISHVTILRQHDCPYLGSQSIED
jgi:hypothetical protein